MTDQVPIPLIDRLATALESARDSIVDMSRTTSFNEYGAVGEALCIDKLLDEYREWRKTNSTQVNENITRDKK